MDKPWTTSLRECLDWCPSIGQPHWPQGWYTWKRSCMDCHWGLDPESCSPSAHGNKDRGQVCACGALGWWYPFVSNLYIVWIILLPLLVLNSSFDYWLHCQTGDKDESFAKFSSLYGSSLPSGDKVCGKDITALAELKIAVQASWACQVSNLGGHSLEHPSSHWEAKIAFWLWTPL